ncbi:MAG TPA: Hsp20/alpha crystallin family protein [Bryobacteraceae bacterium]|nr:Hsp20/alpha crystallin family protein [Bryobacteraceae bacterium]
MADVKVTKSTIPEKGLVPIPDFDLSLDTPLFRAGVFGKYPFAWMKLLSEELDRFMTKGTGEAVWRPVIEVSEDKDRLLVRAELPGLKKEEVKVSVADDVLVIEGERKLEKEEKREGYFRSERSYGKFYRAIPLPEGATADKTTAKFADGVLEVAIPIPEMKTKMKEIPISEGAAKTAVTH